MHEAIKAIALERSIAQIDADNCHEVAPVCAKRLQSLVRELTAVMAPLQWRPGDPTSPGYWWVKTRNLPPCVVLVDASLRHVYYSLGDRQNPFQCAGPIPEPV